VIPLDYLRVTRRGKEIKPVYLSDVSAAAEVLEAARGAKTLGDFRKAVEALRGDRKLLGGLARLVEQLMEVEEVDSRLVARVRLEVFKASSAAGFPLTPEEREKIFEAAAAQGAHGRRRGEEAVHEGVRGEQSRVEAAGGRPR